MFKSPHKPPQSLSGESLRGTWTRWCGNPSVSGISCHMNCNPANDENTLSATNRKPRTNKHGRIKMNHYQLSSSQ